jgi:hypothetical protein
VVKKLFFSTIDKNISNVSDILIRSTYLHSANGTDVELLFKSQTITNRFSGAGSLSLLIMLLYGLFLAIVRPKKTALVKYRAFTIGRYSVATAYRSFNAYKRRRHFILRYVKSLFKCAQIINTIESYQNNISAAFIDHGCYENGVYVDVLSRLNIPIYLNDYPFGLFRWEPKTGSSYDAALQVPKYSVTTEDLALGEKALMERTGDSDKIPYLSVKFERYKSEKQFDYVIYTHSFTDAQCLYGYDGAFNNVLEWLEFTIETLGTANICVKVHPAIYTEGASSQVFEWDKALTLEFIAKYGSHDNVHIIDYAIANSELLNQLRGDTVLVSHHSNALLEGAALGFKSICAGASNWTNFDLFNSWASEEAYRTLLQLTWSELRFTDLQELYHYYFIANYGQASFFKSHWLNEIADITGFEYKELFVDASDLETLSVDATDECVKNISKSIKVV